LRKVVRFVANPTTDWTELDAPVSEEDRESEYAKSEIKAMIERKRRNDFVRKRELDMLRKIRREGLSPDNALLLGSASRLDPDSRPQNGARSDIAVKAKIDEIEKYVHILVNQDEHLKRTNKDLEITNSEFKRLINDLRHSADLKKNRDQ